MDVKTETQLTVFDDDGERVPLLGEKTSEGIGKLHKEFEDKLKKYLKKRLRKGKIGE